MIINGMEVTPELVRGLKLRYPNVKSIDDELDGIALWLAKNPARASKIKRPIRFLENCLKRKNPKIAARPKLIPAWWTSDDGTMKQAAIVGLHARPGEEMSQFRNRIMEKMREAA
jgi:hypothetical protein